MAQARVPVFYDISRYLTDKYFDIIWGATPFPPGTPPNGPPKINFFELFNLGCRFVLISGDI